MTGVRSAPGTLTLSDGTRAPYLVHAALAGA